MEMTNGEILASYRAALYPAWQVVVLSELNLCTVDEIKRILISQGVDPKALAKKPTRRWSHAAKR